MAVPLNRYASSGCTSLVNTGSASVVKNTQAEETVIRMVLGWRERLTRTANWMPLKTPLYLRKLMPCLFFYLFGNLSSNTFFSVQKIEWMSLETQK